ncbi:MAG: hypothetical protein IJ853_04160 [Rickettsiales bacterium]|nr:hypothetical protein [Rickettsiales bacterium]
MPKKHIDFTDYFLSHTRMVQDGMMILENNIDKLEEIINVKDFDLFKRSMAHDTDKLTKGLIENYIKISEYHYNKRNNLPNNIDINRILDKREKHYSNQRHHFYMNSIEPNDVDICEMCCDVNAVAIKSNEKDNMVYFNDVMIHEYPKILKYKDKILTILSILQQENNDVNTDKSRFMTTVVTTLRKIQDNRLTLEKNFDLLSDPFEEWSLFRDGFKLDVDNINKNINSDTNDFEGTYNNVLNYYYENGKNKYELYCEAFANEYLYNKYKDNDGFNDEIKLMQKLLG